MYPYILQGTNLSIFIDGVLHQIGGDHLSYNGIMEAIKAGDKDKVKSLVDARKAVEDFSNGSVTIKGDEVFWNGMKMHGAITTRMISMMREGFDISPLVNFMDRLMQNPSKQAVDEAYMFFEACDLPITPDGYFLAFKKVNDNFFDVHSGTVCNKPAHMMSLEEAARFKPGVISGKKGEVCVQVRNGITHVSMPRNMVDDKRDNTCSEGLHFCSKSYLNNFGGSRIVVLKIDPKDVVSIPSDYNNAKGRCSSYQVVDELKVDAAKAFTKAVQTTANGSIAPVAVPTPTVDLSGPKKGSSDFYKGYSHGYKGNDYDWNGPVAYDEGFDKGSDDQAAGLNPRYEYVDPTAKPTSRPLWPSPKGS
jgi:hypothetical protein